MAVAEVRDPSAAIGTDPEDGGIAVPAHLSAALEGVLSACPLEALANLKQVAVGRHHRTGGGIEGLIGAVAEAQRRVRAIERGERGRGTSKADAGLHREGRR